MVELKSGAEIRSLLNMKGINFEVLAKEFNLHSSNIGRKINNPETMSAIFLFSLSKFAEIDVYEFLKTDKSEFKKTRKRKSITNYELRRVTHYEYLVV